MTQRPVENPELLAWVDTLRRLIEQTVHLNADVHLLKRLHDQLEVLSEAIEPLTHGERALGRYHPEQLDGTNMGGVLPYSPVTGRYNPIAPPVQLSRDGQRLIGRVSCSEVYAGVPGWVHGAIIAAVYDQLMAIANVMNQTPGPTASLDVRYLKPTPLHTELVFEAWVASQEGRKVTLQGQCSADGTVVSTAEGLFIASKTTP